MDQGDGQPVLETRNADHAALLKAGERFRDNIFRAHPEKFRHFPLIILVTCLVMKLRVGETWTERLAATFPDAAKLRADDFLDGEIMLELEREGFIREIYSERPAR